MAIEAPYNVHFELSSAGRVALARSCGGGWWEEWVCVRNEEWRRLAELLLDGRASERVSDRAALRRARKATARGRETRQNRQEPLERIGPDSPRLEPTVHLDAHTCTAVTTVA
jgi:hypothetical protein